MQECNNFWSKLERTGPLQLLYYSQPSDRAICGRATVAAREPTKPQIQESSAGQTEHSGAGQPAEKLQAEPNSEVK